MGSQQAPACGTQVCHFAQAAGSGGSGVSSQRAFLKLVPVPRLDKGAGRAFQGEGPVGTRAIVQVQGPS